MDKVTPEMIEAGREADKETGGNGYTSDSVYRAIYLAMHSKAVGEVTTDECEFGHRFAKLMDHPMREFKSRCPHCMAEGLDEARAAISTIRKG